MYIKKLKFKNFRNLLDSEIFPHKEINVVFGDNAQGKTNLLECIWIFTGGHSFRGNKDNELPKLIDGKNSKIANMEIDFFSGSREQNAKLNIENGRRNSVINGVKKNTGSALVGKICAVIFSPEHLSLIKDGPSERRSFVDGAICQITPSYASLLSKYNRVVIQRNAFLKEIQSIEDNEIMLDIWNEKLVEFGTLIAKKRHKYLKELNLIAKEIYKGISGDKEKIDIEYKPLGIDWCDKEFSNKYREILKKSVKTDIRLGVTSVGVHRDDIDIYLDKNLARKYASQGQQRSIVISMKLSEAQILEKKILEPPIIILDDVMSELDNNRQDYILNKLVGRQIFISCCSPETVSLMEKGKMFRLSNGEIMNEK